MLQAAAIASPPSARMSAAAASQAYSLRLEITTRAPASAMWRAIARPIPRG
jgi:hypothetical protein